MVSPYNVEGSTFVPGKSREWTATVILTGTQREFDLAPGGKRFVIFPSPAAVASKESLHLTFLLNFFDDLKRRLPGGTK
jgi:hypothetical protein